MNQPTMIVYVGAEPTQLCVRATDDLGAKAVEQLNDGADAVQVIHNGVTTWSYQVSEQVWLDKIRRKALADYQNGRIPQCHLRVSLLIEIDVPKSIHPTALTISHTEECLSEDEEMDKRNQWREDPDEDDPHWSDWNEPHARRG